MDTNTGSLSSLHTIAPPLGRGSTQPPAKGRGLAGHLTLKVMFEPTILAQLLCSSNLAMATPKQKRRELWEAEALV